MSGEKLVLITGAANGTGRAISQHLAQTGYQLLLVDSDADGLNSLASFIGESHIFASLDLRKTSSIESLRNRIETSNLKIYGLINYAGSTNFGSISNFRDQVLDEVLDLNIRATLALTKLAISHADSEHGLRIILVGSPHMFAGDEDRGLYAVSKGSLITLNANINKHYFSKRIRSNIVILGWTDTEGEEKLRLENGFDLDWRKSSAVQSTPLSRLIQPNEYNQVIEFLLSSDAELMSGSTINMAGGLVI